MTFLSRTVPMLVCAAVLFRGSLVRAQAPTAPDKAAAAATQAQAPATQQPPAVASSPVQGQPVAVPKGQPVPPEGPVVVGSQPDPGLEFKPGSDAPLPVVKPVVPPSAPSAAAQTGKMPKVAANDVAKQAIATSPTNTASPKGLDAAVPATQSPAVAQPLPIQTKGGKRGKDAPPGPAPASAASGPYVIGPLDVLEIKIWNDPRLSGIFDVRPDGMISMNLIGEMKADGLTPAELTDVVKRKLAATVMNDEDPPVLIQVARINSKKYSIIGGCLRNGDFPLIGATTVLDALVNCGGFKEFANQKKIYVLRGSTKYPFNYKDAINGRRPEQNIYLQNGDRVVVPE